MRLRRVYSLKLGHGLVVANAGRYSLLLCGVLRLTAMQ